jgi:hypothetical protein
VNRQDGDRDNGCKHGGQHDDDEPCGAIGGLRRGLGDSHGVDEGVRDELDELHIRSMVAGRDSSRNPSRCDVSDSESEGPGVHL